MYYSHFVIQYENKRLGRSLSQLNSSHKDLSWSPLKSQDWSWSFCDPSTAGLDVVKVNESLELSGQPV